VLERVNKGRKRMPSTKRAEQGGEGGAALGDDSQLDWAASSLVSEHAYNIGPLDDATAGVSL